MKSCSILIPFLFCVKFIDSATFRCDYKYSSLTNGWFKFHDVPAVWEDARLRCALEGAILASPVTGDMWYEMTNVTRGNLLRDTELFTGLHATVSKGAYYTVDGKSMSEFNYVWNRYRPNIGSNMKKCLTLNSEGALSEISCDAAHTYMCFKSNDPETVTNECGTTDLGYKLDSRTNHCYKFHVVARNFSRAHFACSAEGGYLAIINNELESHVLRELFAKHPPNSMLGTFQKTTAFVGFYDWEEKYDWRTIHGQTLEEAGFNKWAPNTPDDAAPGENCGTITRDGLLNDQWCSVPGPFICEKDPKIPEVCSNVPNNQEQVEQWQARQ